MSPFVFCHGLIKLFKGSEIFLSFHVSPEILTSDYIMKQDIKVSVDAVVFGYDQEQGVSLLLIKRKNEPFQKMWALPGGLVLNGESLDKAVARELNEEA